MSDTLQTRAAAHQFRQFGFNVNLLDGNKHPIHKWKSTPDYTIRLQTAKDFADLPWDGYTRKNGDRVPPPVGVAGINGIGDLRTLDLDKRTDPELVTLILAAMDLPADYAWVTLSGSHKGNGIAVRCADAIPESLLPYFTGTTSKILVGTPRDGGNTFKQLELRYSGCQTVMPPSLHPSGNFYEWLHGEPDAPPAVVTFEQLLAGFLAIADLPTLPAPVVLPTTAALELSSRTTPRTTGRVDYKETIARIKQEICLLSEMERRGCIVVARRGTMLDLSGMAGDPHENKTTYTLTPSTRGPGYIGMSQSTGGILNKNDYPRGFDVVTLLTDLDHGGSTVELMKWFNPIEPTKGNNVTFSPEPARYTDEQKAAWRASKNAANAAAAAECRDFCSAYAATDARLAPCDRVTARAMLGWAAAHNSSTCMMGRASLARVTGYSLGSIKRSVMHLEALGYFASEGKGGRPIDTARRNFSRGSLFEDRTILEPKNDPRIVYKLDLVQESVDLVSAPPAPACENVYAASIEDWAWCADEHSADELSAAESKEPFCSFDFNGITLIPLNPPTLRQSYGRYQVSDGARFGDWSATEAGAWETWGASDFQKSDAQTAETCLISTFDDSAQPEIASYVAVELPEKPYSGRNKHAMDTAARYALVWETMRRRDDADVADQAETANFADTPTPKPRQQSDTPRAIDRYLVELAGMSESELAGELKKHRATLKKHSGAKWLSGIRDRLALVEHEIDDRGSSTRPNERRGSQAPARRLAPSAGVQAAFI